MKTIITAFAVLIGVQAALASNYPAPQTFAIVTGDMSIGHGCAVNGLTITNHHMVDKYNKDGDLETVFFRYEFPGGGTGWGKSVKVSKNADLAVVSLDAPPPFGFAELGPKPEIGDKVYWVEYNFEDPDEAMRRVERRAEVSNVVAGYITADKEVVPGASGGCVYNEAGQVVGLVTFGMGLGRGRSAIGITGLWGKWFTDVAK